MNYQDEVKQRTKANAELAKVNVALFDKQAKESLKKVPQDMRFVSATGEQWEKFFENWGM